MFYKKTILTLLLGLLPLFAQSQTPRVIVVNFPPPQSSSGTTNHPHAPLRPLAEGYYDLETDELVLNFNYDVGISLISVNNTAGESSQMYFDTSLGTFVMPLSGELGLYSVSILSEDGALLSTQFLLV